MDLNYRHIHIGYFLKQCVELRKMEASRICNYFNCSEMDIAQMYASENIEVGLLLRWCKLLEYDFFRLYSQHLILYSPPSKLIESFGNGKTSLPFFRKNIYTKEIIDFIIEQIDTGKKTKKQIVDEYKIPKTTLYKWINKYKVNGVSGL